MPNEDQDGSLILNGWYFVLWLEQKDLPLEYILLPPNFLLTGLHHWFLWSEPTENSKIATDFPLVSNFKFPAPAVELLLHTFYPTCLLYLISDSSLDSYQSAMCPKGVVGPDSVTGGRGRGVRSGRKCLTVLWAFELLRCSSNAPSTVFVSKRGKTLNFWSRNGKESDRSYLNVTWLWHVTPSDVMGQTGGTIAGLSLSD